MTCISFDVKQRIGFCLRDCPIVKFQIFRILLKHGEDSPKSRLPIIQFEIVHKFHYSKEKMNKMYANVSEICDRCNTARSTHTLWSCPMIVPFRQNIFNWCCKIYDLQIVCIDRPVWSLWSFSYTSTNCAADSYVLHVGGKESNFWRVSQNLFTSKTQSNNTKEVFNFFL